jgi:spermidine synthase
MTSKKSPSEIDVSEIREYHSSSGGFFFKVKSLPYSHQSSYQKIEVIENEYFGKVLLLDGLVQTTERDEFYYHEMLVYPAFMTHPSPQDILIIGGGDGGALKEILRYPVKRLWLVEIDSQVIEASKKFFPWLSPGLEDERVELVIEDGNEFIQKTNRKFDVVLVDSSDPVGPSSCLHEEDFYKELKGCLNPEGVVVTQSGSPFYHLEELTKKSVFLNKIFKVVSFYTGPVPSYPGGTWCYVYLSDEINPLELKRDPPAGLKYFNQDIHKMAFSLPNFLKDKLNRDSLD